MFTENLAGFFRKEDFGAEAVYDGVKTIYGTFDRAYQEAFAVEGTQPVFLCATADVDDNPAGKTLDIKLATGTEAWKIRKRKPQDDGATVLLQLELQ